MPPSEVVTQNGNPQNTHRGENHLCVIYDIA